MAVVGIGLKGGVRVDLVVDIGKGQFMLVDVLVGRQEERQRYPQQYSADHCLPYFPPKLHYLQPQQRGIQSISDRFREDGLKISPPFNDNQRIYMQMEDKDLPPPKQSFCRFYLRGLCVFSAKDCPFAHGVWDLIYTPWQGQEVIYDYHKSKDDRQRNVVKAPCIYKDLYDFQQEKIFTLEQLSTEKPARHLVRKLMHQQLYDDFMQLLEATHPGLPLSETLLHREYNRVGFNKIYMADVKFTQIAGYLCDNPPHSKYYRATINKQNFLARKAPLSDILDAYRKVFTQIMGESTEIDEGALKKKIYTAQMPEGVPPINLVLKQLKISLREFLEERLEIKGGKLAAECSVEMVTELAVKFLQEELPKRVVEWQDVFQYLSKALKNNNGNLINQAKPQLVLAGHAFLCFPMLQLIYTPARPSPFPRVACLCPFQKPYPIEELLISPLAQAEPLVEGQSYDIYNFETLRRCAPHILASGVLGVDLQGRLRRGGFVEMVQLNNGRNTFLFDIWHMNELGDFEAFWLARKVLRNAMLDENIVKIFHDCRHDSIGLHEMLETCIVNVFDTSACETLIGQIEAYERLWKETEKQGNEGNKEGQRLLAVSKQVLSQCGNVRTPGLNEIFQRYEASHGINKNKDKYHKMWSKGDFSFFCKRPIDPDYRDYCIRDVLDLPEVYAKMLARLEGPAEQLAYWISNEYIRQGFEALTEEKGK